jgi:hypothetical protein
MGSLSMQLYADTYIPPLVQLWETFLGLPPF